MVGAHLLPVETNAAYEPVSHVRMHLRGIFPERRPLLNQVDIREDIPLAVSKPAAPFAVQSMNVLRVNLFFILSPVSESNIVTRARGGSRPSSRLEMDP